MTDVERVLECVFCKHLSSYTGDANKFEDAEGHCTKCEKVSENEIDDIDKGKKKKDF